jgi:hypothetical protein
VKKRDRRALGRYCRDLADKLELRDWTVYANVGKVADSNHPDGWTWHATSESTPGRKHVAITFAADCREWDRQTLRLTAAHELIHAHLAPLMEIFRVDLHPHLKAQAYDLLNSSATRWMEYAVEALAEATARHLPLIEWPDAKN